MTDSLMNTYNRLPVTFEHGEGVWLWDDKGNKYLDALGGIAVCGLGHAHPAVTAAVCEQAGKLVHTSNLYGIKNQEQLGNELASLSGMEKIFFCNSGAEANEAAIKIARKFGHSKGINEPVIIVTNGSFHGRTLATLTATGNRKVQAGFEPLVQGFARVDFSDVDAIKTIAKNSANVVAILVEPIQGEGGINIPDDNYLNQLRDLCDQHDWLLMLDEIQTGLCRTGKWFAFQHNNITPDVMTLAKALGNGVPIGACLAHGKAASVLQAGNHGTTFGGNPLACSAGLAVIETIKKNKLDKQSQKMGTYLLDAFNKALSSNPQVTDIRGKGLMIGIELAFPCAELVKLALDKGLLINVTAEKVIRLLPPLIINKEDADVIANGVIELINEFSGQSAVGL